MAEFKIVLSDPKTGKSIQKEAKELAAKPFMGKKIGEAVKGELLELPGYEFVITGGSDSSGFPMRQDVDLPRKRITAVSGIGVHNKLRKPNPKKKGWRKMEGMRLKKTVAGNMIHDKTAQINMKVTKKGRDPIFGEEPAPKQAEKAEPAKKAAEKPAAKPAEKPAPKPAEKQASKPAEKQAAKPAKDDSDNKKLFDEVDEIDKKVKKDAEEVEEETKEIDELEDELKKTDKEMDD